MQFLPNNAKRSVITRDMYKALNSSRTTASRKSTSASGMRSVSFVDEVCYDRWKVINLINYVFNSVLNFTVLFSNIVIIC